MRTCSKPRQARRVTTPRLAALARSATTHGAVLDTFPSGCGQKGHALRSESLTEMTPPADSRLAHDLFGEQRIAKNGVGRPQWAGRSATRPFRFAASFALQHANGPQTLLRAGASSAPVPRPMQSTLRCAHRPWGGLPRDGRQRSTINRAQQPRLRIKSDARNPVVCHDWEAKPRAGGLRRA